MPSSAAPSEEDRAGWRLPVELLLQSLMAADMASRILASHVSRLWREAALTDRRLWDSFSCAVFRNKHHEAVMFSLLQEMLLRSRSLPFHLSIPDKYEGSDIEYASRLLGLETFDVLRLASYHGPVRVFVLLNPTSKPLPSLICLQPTGHDDFSPLEMSGIIGVGCLPNIRQLIAGHVSFPAGGAPFTKLECLALPGYYCGALFIHFPHLVRLVITNTTMGRPLPDSSPPASLDSISVRCQRPRALDFIQLMQGWRGIRVPHIFVHEVYSLRGVLPFFLASHAQPIELRLISTDHAVTLAALPCDGMTLDKGTETIWTIDPSPAWAADFLASIEKPASERLTSISVSFARLGTLFNAQLHVPGLERLAICLTGETPAELNGPPLQTREGFFLRAPSLRRIGFNFHDGVYAPELAERLENIRGALVMLRESFRALVVYDATLLDAICVSRQAERECAGFSHLAKEYTPVTRGSWSLE